MYVALFFKKYNNSRSSCIDYQVGCYHCVQWHATSRVWVHLNPVKSEKKKKRKEKPYSVWFDCPFGAYGQLNPLDFCQKNPLNYCHHIQRFVFLHIHQTTGVYILYSLFLYFYPLISFSQISNLHGFAHVKYSVDFVSLIRILWSWFSKKGWSQKCW